MNYENMTSDCLQRKVADLRPPPTYRAADPPPTLGQRSTSVCIGSFVICFVLSALCDEAAKSCWAAGFTVPTCDTNGVLQCCKAHECVDRPDLTNLSPSWWKRTEHNCDHYTCGYRVMQMAGSYNGNRVVTEMIRGYASEPSELVYMSPYPYAVCGATKGASYVLVIITAFAFVRLCIRVYHLLLVYACSALSVEARHVD